MCLAVLILEGRIIMVGNRIYRQTIGIPMGTNCAPLLATSLPASHLSSTFYLYTMNSLCPRYIDNNVGIVCS